MTPARVIELSSELIESWHGQLPILYHPLGIWHVGQEAIEAQEGADGLSFSRQVVFGMVSDHHGQAASTYKKGGSALRRRNGAPTSEVLPIRLPIFTAEILSRWIAF